MLSPYFKLTIIIILTKFYIYNINNLHCLLDCKEPRLYVKYTELYFTHKKGTPPFSRLSAACLFMYIVTLELYRMSVWLNSL